MEEKGPLLLLGCFSPSQCGISLAEGPGTALISSPSILVSGWEDLCGWLLALFPFQAATGKQWRG